MSENITDLVDDVENAVEDVEETITLFEKKIDWITKARDQWDERDPSERESFQDAADELLSDLRATSDNTEDLLSVVQDIQDAYQYPVLDSLQELITAIANEFEIPEKEFELNKSKIRDRYKDSAASARSKYQVIHSKLADTPDPVIAHISSDYQEDPFLLFNPDRIQSDLETASSRYNSLNELARSVNESDWGPDETNTLLLTEGHLSHPVNLDQTLSIVEQIDNFVSEYGGRGAGLKTVIANEISSSLTKENRPPSEILNNTYQELGELSGVLDDLEVAIEISDRYPELAEKIGLSERVQDIQERQYDSIEDLKSDLERASSNLEDWKASVQTRWQRVSDILQIYVENLDILSEQLPDEIEETLENGLPVDSDPVLAYDIFTSAENWLSEQEDSLRDEMHDDAVDLLNALITQDQILATKYSPQAIAEVSSEIPILLKLADE
jgi:predicted  nucleic acid-binding Zn-ribbon protein